MSGMLWRINGFVCLSEGITHIAIDPVAVVKASKQDDRITTEDTCAGLQQEQWPPVQSSLGLAVSNQCG
jgi:hypothetical protein